MFPNNNRISSESSLQESEFNLSENVANDGTRPSMSVENLISAVQYGDYKFLKDCIELHGANPNTCDIDNCSLLHWAAINNRVKIARYLIAKGANTNAIGGHLRETPLQWACRNDDFTFMVRLLVKEGRTDIHLKSAHGLDALHITVRCGSYKLTFMLLQFGANPNSLDNFQETPLVYCIKHQMKELVEIEKLLMQYGARLDATDRDNNNVLHIMSNLGPTKVDFAIAEKIYVLGGLQLRNSMNADGKTPWDIAWRKKDTVMMQYFIDMLMYAKFPSWIPIVATGVFLPIFLQCLRSFSVFQSQSAFANILNSSFLFSVMYLLWDRVFSQSMVITKLSRQSNGFAWGIIINLAIEYFTSIDPLVEDKQFKYVVIFIFIVICVTLFISGVTPPQHIARNKTFRKRSRLVNGIVVLGIFDGLVKKDLGDYDEFEGKNNEIIDGKDNDIPQFRNRSAGYLKAQKEQEEKYEQSDDKKRLNSIFHARPEFKSELDESNLSDSHLSDETSNAEPDWRYIEPIRLCSICIVDRSMVTHCTRCDMCIEDIDHHCVFVNNCVAKGNRRVFLWFTISASLGCLLFVLFGFWALYSHYCPREGDVVTKFLKVQYCAAYYFPTLAISTCLAIVCVVWIGGIAIGQLGLLSAESTTFEVMKSSHIHSNRNKSDHDNKGRSYLHGRHVRQCNCTLQGLHNIARFCWTGNYRTIRSIMLETTEAKSAVPYKPLVSRTTEDFRGISIV